MLLRSLTAALLVLVPFGAATTAEVPTRVFRADLNGVDQVLPPAATPDGQYFPFAGKHLSVDLDSGFDVLTGTFTPPPGVVLCQAVTWVRTGVGGSSQIVGKIYKDGYLSLTSGVGARVGYANSQEVSFGAIDVTDGSWTYSYWVYTNANTPVVIDGNKAHSQWGCIWWGLTPAE